jgi:hypothetical protein
VRAADRLIDLALLPELEPAATTSVPIEVVAIETGSARS